MRKRLQVVLAEAGVASRRRSEALIRAGRVRVDGHVVTEMGVRVDPAIHRIEVDGQPLPPPQKKVYLLVHKPRGYISTCFDPQGRPTVLDLVPSDLGRLYPVGRLDFESEGLLILTNDGEFALRLAHPRYHQEKEYRVLIAGHPNEETLRRLRQGVTLDDGLAMPTKVENIGREREGTWLSITLHEGRKRQVRRMCEAVGCAVRRLIRVRMGPLELGDLAPGQYRRLNAAEITTLIEIPGPLERGALDNALGEGASCEAGELV
ncbi:MAG: rRNA pseudouridine synthase [Chloroflexi bacterium]|nr:rRNA pseudouridine synthase [Chloroflexota bacterium]